MKCKGCKYYEEARFSGTFKLYRYCHWGGATKQLHAGDTCPKEEAEQYKAAHQPKPTEQKKKVWHGVIEHI